MIKLALLDLYKGEPNLHIGAIEELLSDYEGQFKWERFDVRKDGVVPALSDFDIFISSGGPGDPLLGEGEWQAKWHHWLDELWAHNLQSSGKKKYAFFICHSFQMLCHHFKLGEITMRETTSFGLFPVYPTDAARKDPIFGKLPDPFYVADFRDFQVINPDPFQFKAIGAEMLALEKERSLATSKRALMAIRMSDEIIGVQFHPETHLQGMYSHFQDESKTIHLINKIGKKKFEQMIRDLYDPNKIQLTYKVLMPTFLENALEGV